MTKPMLYYYSLPSERGEGWAEIVIGSNGYFSAVSDWGNYAYRWTAIANADAREFFLDKTAHYMCSKIAPGRRYDGDATYAAIVKHLEEERASREIGDGLTPDEGYEDLHALEGWECEIRDSELGFAKWCHETETDDAWQFQVNSACTQAMAFCERVMPRLAKAIRAELAGGAA